MRMENLQADSFARDYHIDAELGADESGKITALKIKTVADHGYADATCQPSKCPAGLFSICTGSYDVKHAFAEVDGVYTNKPPGGIAYRCSFRVTEAVHAIERVTDIVAAELNEDPAQFRLDNFIPPDRFPYKSVLGWEYDSGNYAGALKKAMEKVGYEQLRREQAEKRKAGRADGDRYLQLHRGVGAGPSKHFDILGIKMFDSWELRVHPTGKAMARFATKSQGRGTRRPTPRSSPRSSPSPQPTCRWRRGHRHGAVRAGNLREPVHADSRGRGHRGRAQGRDKARKIAAHLLEVSRTTSSGSPAGSR